MPSIIVLISTLSFQGMNKELDIWQKATLYVFRSENFLFGISSYCKTSFTSMCSIDLSHDSDRTLRREVLTRIIIQRASGKPGVVLVTSGPGATNVVTPSRCFRLLYSPISTSIRVVRRFRGYIVHSGFHCSIRPVMHSNLHFNSEILT